MPHHDAGGGWWTFDVARYARVARHSLVSVVLVLVVVACAPRTAVAVGGGDHLGTRPSPGCAAPGSASVPERLTVDGQQRNLLVTVPDGDHATPRDLVIAFHGRTNDAAQVRRYFHLDEALPNAVIVYPRALRANPGSFSWSAPGDPAARLRDFALVDAIIDAFGRVRCLDLDRVFVVGHSLGASFANDVACHLGARIRAVASVAGGLQGGPCVPGTAALIIHHPDDLLVPLNEGERVRDAFLAANALDSASADPTQHAALARLRCVRYGDAATAQPVVWCVHDDATSPGGGYDPHTWPDGAAAAISTFFASLP